MRRSDSPHPPSSAIFASRAAAGAFALINSVGNLSGFVGPGMMGYLLQSTGSYRVGMLMCTAVPLLAAVSMALPSGSLKPKA